MREADHGVVDGGVAVRVVVAHDVADDLGGLGVLLVELEAHLLHAVKDAAMHGLEAVADIGESAADDDRHGVIEVGAAHLLFEVDRRHEEGAGAGGRGGAITAGAACHEIGLQRAVGVRVLWGGRSGIA